MTHLSKKKSKSLTPSESTTRAYILKPKRNRHIFYFGACLTDLIFCTQSCSFFSTRYVLSQGLLYILSTSLKNNQSVKLRNYNHFEISGTWRKTLLQNSEYKIFQKLFSELKILRYFKFGWPKTGHGLTHSQNSLSLESMKK